MTTTHNDLIDIAFDNVYAASRGFSIQGYSPLAQPTAESFEVGQVVAIYSRGNERLAVIEKVGKKNITALYVTDGGIEQAKKTYQSVLSLTDEKVAARVAGAEEQARKNWDFHTSPHKPYAFATAEDNAVYAARHAEEGAAFRAENPDREAYAKAAGAKERERLEGYRAEAKEFGVRAYVNVTRKTVHFDSVGVKVQR